MPASRGEGAEMQAGRKSTSRTIEIYDVLPPDPSARRAAPPARPVLVEDAVFEVVGPARPRREHNDNPPKPSMPGKPDMARLAAVAGVHVVRWLERGLSGLSPQAFATLVASLFFIVFWVCGGLGALASQSIVKPAASFTIEQVFTEELDENGMRLLAVGGMLRNGTGTGMVPPPLSVTGEGGEIIGMITASTAELAAGQSVRFFGRFNRTGGKSGPVTIFPVAR